MPKWLAGLGIGALMLTSAVLAAPIVGFAQDSGTPPAAADDAVLNPTIGLIEAQEIALAGQAGVAVRSVDLERERGVLVWSIDLDNGDEIEIDGSTGEIVRTEHDDDDDDDDDD